ncbi:DNA-binding protein, histone-like, putative [Bacteroides faecichinchillae]|uniref:DNA-binding protein, histone-like, putative n=1 Tax=Bacteroides faecichinchillae TaxID=871325 RepID=A0A1M5AIR4_9BACE|nr:HU family DNA-binding protein [Bacteroides faecichinchillae]THG68946.1 DNA-binding protein [Bacteroides faecichinchillae]SHF30024.1 DNA-binding protein, histone-like, putative [Bacteroides faecichinchillae]
MSALYDFFLTPQPKDSNKKRYHARLVVRDTITLEDIAGIIESRSSLRKGDVIGSFIEFANVFKDELSNGNSIHIEGVGSFRIKAESPEVRSPKEIRAEHIRCAGVVFTPEKELLRKLKATTFEKVRETRRSQELSDIEIDGKLAEFFKDHDYITTRQLCALCGLRKATSLRRLQKRVEEGRMTHPGYLRSPFYFPVPGWFGVSRNR